jgi:hypothetical protein
MQKKNPGRPDEPRRTEVVGMGAVRMSPARMIPVRMIPVRMIPILPVHTKTRSIPPVFARATYCGSQSAPSRFFAISITM